MGYKILYIGFILLLFNACKMGNESSNLSNDCNTTQKTLAFIGAEGFGKYAKGARGVAHPKVYIVKNLNNSGEGSFRDAVSLPGRFIVFAVSGIIQLQSQVTMADHLTIAGQTASGSGIVLYGQKVSFTGANHTIARYLRIRLGTKDSLSKNTDASGIANGKNMILDHMSVSWGLDEVFSINWDKNGFEPDSITIQNSIIAQGLHRYNHSAGGLIQSENGHISIIKTLYSSNKTRNSKIKGKNEYINNVVYNYGNKDNPNGHSVSGAAYIMGGSAMVSEVNIINNYFISGPLTLATETTPFSRGTETFNIYASGNYFDSNKNGLLDGTLVSEDSIGYPGITNFKIAPFNYPYAYPTLSAAQAYDYVKNNSGANYPISDEVDQLLLSELASKGRDGLYVYTEKELPFVNNGLGNYTKVKPPKDSDQDGIPDAWEIANGLDANDASDALAYSAICENYLNIEIYINTIIK